MPPPLGIRWECAGLAFPQAFKPMFIDRALSCLSPPRATVNFRRGSSHLASVDAEVAGNLWRRAHGLMGRRFLADGEGMLLVYPSPRVVRVWMAGMRLAIDVLFIDGAGRVVKIVPRLRPSATQLACSGGPVSQVLETAAGLADRLGIRVGDGVLVAAREVRRIAPGALNDSRP